MIRSTMGIMGKGMTAAEPVNVQQILNDPVMIAMREAIESLPPLARAVLLIHVTLLAQRKLLALLDGPKK